MESSSSIIDQPLALQQSPPLPGAAITYDDGAMRFDVNGVEAFRLTTDGMHYQGQLVADGGLAHSVVLSWFLRLRDAMADHDTGIIDHPADSDDQSAIDFDDPLN